MSSHRISEVSLELCLAIQRPRWRPCSKAVVHLVTFLRNLEKTLKRNSGKGYECNGCADDRPAHPRRVRANFVSRPPAPFGPVPSPPNRAERYGKSDPERRDLESEVKEVL